MTRALTLIVILSALFVSGATRAATKKKAKTPAAADAETPNASGATFSNAPAPDSDLVSPPVAVLDQPDPNGAGGAPAGRPAAGDAAKKSDVVKVFDPKAQARLALLEASSAMWDRKKAHGAERCSNDATMRTPDDPLGPLVLELAPDGTLACTLPDSIDEGRRFEVMIWSCRDPRLDYALDADEGPRVTDWIRWTGAEKLTADTPPPQCHALRRPLAADSDDRPAVLGPYFDRASLTLHVAWSDAGVDNKLLIPLSHRYLFNLGIAVLGGSGSTTYSVANKTVQADSTKIDLSYDALAQFYPFATYRRDGRLRWGRSFDGSDGWFWENWSRRAFLAAGFSISNPASSLFLGGGYEIAPGVNVVAGWQPRRVQQLKPGWVAGAGDADSSPPTETAWALKSLAVGLSLDLGIAKSIASAFGFK